MNVNPVSLLSGPVSGTHISCFKNMALMGGTFCEVAKGDCDFTDGVVEVFINMAIDPLFPKWQPMIDILSLFIVEPETTLA